jgi:hypothetical protein
MNDAEQRAWEVVRKAYQERPPRPHRARATNSLLLAAAVAAVVVAGAAASAPGQAVIDKVREAVGVQKAEPALFSLPAKGRLLVVSAEHGGAWLVRDDGFKRRLGSYTDAQWSPHGLFVVATTDHQLVALDVDTGVRWTLPRRASWPRWEGTRLDTRIAYMTPGGLRVVAGDGTGDRLLDRFAGDIAPAWDPARLHAVAYYAGRTIVLRSADSRRIVWRRPIGVTPSSLAWSADGRFLAVVSPKTILVLGPSGTVQRSVSQLNATFADAAFRPASHELAVSLRTAAGSQVRVVDLDRPGHGRLLFAGQGVFGDMAWSPDGRWLLLAWPQADQWLFLHGSRVRAVANIREQFPRADDLRPHLEFDGRWCCPG